MLLAGILFWITSMTMHYYIMKHPQIRDICDFGYWVFGKSKIAYEFTGFMLLANNIMLIGFHVLTGAKVLNTLSGHSICTVAFSIIIMLMGILMSVPRTLRNVSFMSMGSGEMNLVCCILTTLTLTVGCRSCLHGHGHTAFHDLRRHRARTSRRLQWRLPDCWTRQDLCFPSSRHDLG